jgi:hypothetical protein
MPRIFGRESNLKLSKTLKLVFLLDLPYLIAFLFSIKMHLIDELFHAGTSFAPRRDVRKRGVSGSPERNREVVQ